MLQDVDHESRLEECLVRHFICNICQDLSEEDASKILNPNEYSLLSEPCTFSAVVKCVQNCICHRQEKTTKTKTTNPIFSAFGDETEKVQQFDLRLYIKSKSRLHNYNNPFDRKLSQKLNARVSVAKSLINAYCHPTNIMPIKESLIGSLNLVNDDTFAE